MEGFKFLLLLILMATAIYFFYAHPNFFSSMIKLGVQQASIPVLPKTGSVANLYNSPNNSNNFNNGKNFIRVLDDKGNVVREVGY